MAARSAWKGAITLGGFPINVVAYSLLQSASAQSFKGLCACHQQPVVMPKRCSVDDTVLGADQILKGVEQGRGKAKSYVALPQDAVDALTAAEATDALEIMRLPKVDSVPWTLATGRYRLVPDPDVAGSNGPVEILWNGLIASERAVISEWQKRANSRTQLVAIKADVYGLTAVDLPYATALKIDAPEHKFEPNEKAQQMFEMFVEAQGYDTADFTHTAFPDSYSERRAKLIALAVAGDPIPVSEVESAPAAVPDLMAAMEAALSNAKPPKKKSAKPKAKATA